MSALKGKPMTEADVVRWVAETCRVFGAQESTALRVAAEFAAAFERGEIAITSVGVSG